MWTHITHYEQNFNFNFLVLFTNTIQYIRILYFLSYIIFNNTEIKNIYKQIFTNTRVIYDHKNKIK
jgi:hypothetical protein